MKIKLIILTVGITFLFYSDLFAQIPFTTVVKEYRFLKPDTTSKPDRYEGITDTTIISQQLTANGDDEHIKPSEKENIKFFKNNGLALNLMNEGENRLSVNSEVLHYKIYIVSPNANNPAKYRYNIPLMLITKLSTSYDSVNASSALDILDYEAAPLTLRIMPSFSYPFKYYNNVLFYGFYIDVRGINLYDKTEDAYDMNFIGSGGIGLTYQGEGEAGYLNGSSEYKSGKYSLSLILQGAFGNKKTISRLFSTSNGYVTSIQSYFRFNVAENSPLNLKIGYLHFFKKTRSGAKSSFSVTVGI